MDNLELSAVLKDDISPTLQGISKRLGEMDKKFSAMGKTAENAGKNVKKSSNDQGNAIAQLAGKIGVAAAAYKAFGFAVDAVAQAGKWEKLQKGLNAMEGGATAGAAAMERMIELSKMPGLGLEEVNKAFLALRSAGMEASTAEKTIKAFGNAVANAGGGAEEFGRIQRQLGQMLAKGRVLQEDITVISESMPGISTLMQEAFGTKNVEAIRAMGVGADEFIARITDMADKMPAASATVSDKMDDMTTAWGRFKASLVDTQWTKGALEGISTGLNDLTTLFTDADARINKSEIFKAWVKGGGIFGPGGGLNVIRALASGKLIETGKEAKQSKLADLKSKYEKTSDHTQATKYAKEIADMERQIAMEEGVARTAKRLDAQAEKARIAQGKAAAKTVTKKAGSVDARSVSVDYTDRGEQKDFNLNAQIAYKAQYAEEDQWSANMADITENGRLNNNSMQAYRAKLQAENEKAMEEYVSLGEQFAGQMAGNMEGVFASAFANIGKKGADLWGDLLEGFKAMLVQMAAEMAAKAVVFGLFSLFTGGAGAVGVGAGGTFLKTILGASTGGQSPSLAPVASASAGVNLTVNLSGGATKKDATTIANTLAAAQRGRLASVVA